MGDRTTFLRYRLAVSVFGLFLMMLGTLPWILFVVADGGWAFLLVLWGFFFLPLLWLGLNVVRLAWRPVRTFSWRDAMAGSRPRPGSASSKSDDVIDAEVVDDR